MLPDNEVYLVFDLDSYDNIDRLYGVFTSEYLAESFIEAYKESYKPWQEFKVITLKVNQMEV